MSTGIQRILGTRQKLVDTVGQTAKAVVGFDGFVDEIIEVVDKRVSPDSYTRVETIAALGERISKAAGLSTNIELVPKQVKLGGNGPIMANALGAANLDITYIGAIGQGAVHPVFTELAANARVIPIADPGHTDALEFRDGKVMLGKLETIKDVNWDNLVAAAPLPELTKLFSEMRLIATVNWTMLPAMNELWLHLRDQVFTTIDLPHTPILFVDLADPEKRTRAELVEALNIIRSFEGTCRTMLGLNRKEASQVADALGIKLSTDATSAPLPEITRAVAKELQFSGLVVHPTAQAACVVDGEFASVDGPYTTTPRLTTGAGDNFNAGFCLGQVLGLSPTESLILGTATSGFYVRQAHSPSRHELSDFLTAWAANYGADF